jgi:hypothetical protein
MIPSTKSLGRLATILCLYPILAVHAFASSPTAAHRFHLPHLTAGHVLATKRNNSGNNALKKGTALHLSIPRGGAVAATAASKLTEWTSSPNSAFNLALGVLGACTAVLKLYGRSGNDSGAVVSCVTMLSYYY